MLTVLKNHMTESKFMVGDRLSVADFNAAYILDWANYVKILDDTPRLRAYLKSMYARPTAPPTIAASLETLERLAVTGDALVAE